MHCPGSVTRLTFLAGAATVLLRPEGRAVRKVLIHFDSLTSLCESGKERSIAVKVKLASGWMSLKWGTNGDDGARLWMSLRCWPILCRSGLDD